MKKNARFILVILITCCYLIKEPVRLKEWAVDG